MKRKGYLDTLELELVCLSGGLGIRSENREEPRTTPNCSLPGFLITSTKVMLVGKSFSRVSSIFFSCPLDQANGHSSSCLEQRCFNS